MQPLNNDLFYKFKEISFMTNFFKSLFGGSEETQEMIALKHGITLASDVRGMSYNGLNIADFNYMAQSYSKHNLIAISDLLELPADQRKSIIKIIVDEVLQDLENSLREPSVNANKNLSNFREIIVAVNALADDLDK